MFNGFIFNFKMRFNKFLSYLNMGMSEDEYTFKLILLPYCMAKLAATFSPDTRINVGSVLFKGTKIYNSSYNSKPLSASKFNECVNPDTQKSYEDLIHSEIKTLINCPVDIKSNKLSLLVTLAPCLRCASAIVESGVSEVWYCGVHDDNVGVKFLRTNGVTVHDYSDRLYYLDKNFQHIFGSLLISNSSKVINFNFLRKYI